MEMGFSVLEERSFEHNIVFDTGDKQLKASKRLLRLRRTGDRYVLTFKRRPPGVDDSSDYKVREEIEIEVSDFENARVILKGLGYGEVFIYEKYREILEREGIHIMLDHTPIGDFLEIEGPGPEIDKLSTALGYTKNDYITDNYRKLFRKQNLTGHMQF